MAWHKKTEKLRGWTKDPRQGYRSGRTENSGFTPEELERAKNSQALRYVAEKVAKENEKLATQEQNASSSTGYLVRVKDPMRSYRRIKGTGTHVFSLGSSDKYLDTEDAERMDLKKGEVGVYVESVVMYVIKGKKNNMRMPIPCQKFLFGDRVVVVSRMLLGLLERL